MICKGIIAIVAAFVSYIRFGKINLAHSTGRIYFYGTVITSLTALGLSKLEGFNPGHVFAIFIVILVLAAYYLNTKKQRDNGFRYFENFFLSFSFFLSWLPTVNETLTRIPVAHPLAKDINGPVIGEHFLLFIPGFLPIK